jgi:hypothetical protein
MPSLAGLRSLFSEFDRDGDGLLALEDVVRDRRKAR